MKYKIDIVRVRENIITINGWAVGKRPDSCIKFNVYAGDKNKIDFKLVLTRRDDVSRIYFGETVDKELGFDIRFEYKRTEDYYLVIDADGAKKTVKFNEELIAKRSSAAHKRFEKIKDLCNMETVRVSLNFLKEHGLRALYRKSVAKIKGIDSDYEYGEWYEKTKPSDEELQRQKKEVFEYMPKFSVAIPAYKTPKFFMTELIESLLAQTYSNFEICIADGSPVEDGEQDAESIAEILARYAKKDSRVKYKIIGENLGISGNTNEALKMAQGDFIVLCDHDDLLPLNALYEAASAINKNRDCDCLYSDEDKLDLDGGALFDPHFKPDFNIDLLRSVNYICHLFIIKRQLLDKIGMFNADYDGAQDYDFIFRACENAQKIVHIPKVLYHWRCHMNSTAANPQSKLYAFEAGARAIRAHYERTLPHIRIDGIEKGIDYGIYHTFFHIESEPLISVIIPNKDHSADLDIAITSLMSGSYRNLEFIVVENNSSLDETWEYYKSIEKKYNNVKVVRWEREFNYSEINNFGVSHASGDYLLFMNNDVELKEKDSLREMLGYVQREDVGICGCKLLYKDDTIQHAGVVVGFGGIAGHTFIGLHDTQNSYFHRAATAQDYSAVTAACMLTKRSVFDAAGGFSKELAVAFNDIDFCMKVRRLGKLIVYTPYAVFYHYESKSRGLEDTPEKMERFNRETASFIKKWPDILKDGDPYYNPNLTLRKSDFSLRDLYKEKIGEQYHIKDIEKYF